MTVAGGNIFAGLPHGRRDEEVRDLLSQPSVTIERIVSTGQATPPGQWLDQAEAEWVIVLQGAARLVIEGEAAPRSLAAGDWLHIPPHIRHRVAWTDPGQATVWLAIHYR